MANRQNVLFILTDQQRADTIAALGNPLIKTPVLDELVESGVAFTRAYTSCPVCVPARYALLTGIAPHQSGCTDNGMRMSEEYPSVMQCLSDVGYQAHGVGKMHFNHKTGPRTLWGFESRDFSEEGGGNDDYKQFLEQHGFGHVCDPHGVRGEMYYIPQPSQLPANLHNTSWVADRSIDFLRGRDRTRPFFLMTSFIKPHPPFENPVPWNKLYRAPEMLLPKHPEGYEGLLTYWNRFQNRYKFRDRGIDLNLIRTMRAAYYGAISFIDYNVGRVLQELRNQDLEGETIIVYTSDHGEMLGDYNSFGKRSYLDAAARVPLLLRYPNGPSGMRCARPVSHLDVMPTLLELTGVPYIHGNSRNLYGESLAAIGEDRLERDFAFGQFQTGPNATYMATTDRYKYIYSAADEKEWLFDSVTDPGETQNLAYNPMFTWVTQELRTRLITMLSESGYEPALDGTNWKHYGRKTMPDDPDFGLLFQDPPASIPNIPGYERDSGRSYTRKRSANPA